MEPTRELEKVLEPGETVLWSAQPEPWYFARPTFMLYIVGVPWTVFTFFWLQAVTGGFHWPGTPVAQLPRWMPWVAIGAGFFLLAMGLLMLSAPYWIWLRGKRTIHALTDRRALVLDVKHPGKLQTLTLEGKVDFRVAHPERNASDIDVVCAGGKGLLFRAVKDPKNVIAHLAQSGGQR